MVLLELEAEEGWPSQAGHRNSIVVEGLEELSSGLLGGRGVDGEAASAVHGV
jgi:hypothetical protein